MAIRAFAALIAAIVLTSVTVPVRAQGYPNGPVRLIVPFPPGGATDVLGRVLAVHLQALWGPPAGTPREIVDKISADARTVLLLPEAKQRLAEQGAEPAPNTPEEFRAFVNADIAKWLDLARKAGIKLTP